jgi:hypothetical protein
MILITAFVSTLCFAKSALSTPTRNLYSTPGPDSNLAAFDGLPHKYGYIRYMGNDPDINSKVKHCVFLNDQYLIAITKCPDGVELSLTQYVYGWIEVSSTDNQFDYVAAFRPGYKDNKDWGGLSIGASDPKDSKINKARLHRFNNYPNAQSSGQNLIKMDEAGKRIINPARNQCLFAKDGEHSVSDGQPSRGDRWFGNETLVWKNCDLVKNDKRAEFLFTKYLHRPEDKGY